MIPTIVQLSKTLEISTFGLLLGLGFYLSFLFFESELKQKGRDPEIAYKMLIAIIPSAIVGAKIFYIFGQFKEFISNPLNILFSGSGLSFYGGLLLSLLVSFAVLKFMKEDFFEIADILAPAILLGYMVGKFGSHLAGFSYGIPTRSFLGVAYPNGYVPTSEPVYPTALFEMFLSFVFFFVAMKLRKVQLPKGVLFFSVIFLNSMTYFLINFITSDTRVFLSMSINQMSSLVAILASAGYIAFMTALKKAKA